MWPFNDELDEWFKQVEADRDAEREDKDDDDGAGRRREFGMKGMVKNEMVKVWQRVKR